MHGITLYGKSDRIRILKKEFFNHRPVYFTRQPITAH
jgi:hypothetical protein